MDEPDSNLDADGTMALARAVEGHKKRGGTVVIVAHRHGAFAQCDIVYLMENGRPVPATSGRSSAPVRQLQSGRRYRPGQPARQVAKKPAPAAEGGKVAALPQPAAPAKTEGAGRSVSRDEQMAAAIARVTGSRDRADAQRPAAGAAGERGPAVMTEARFSTRRAVILGFGGLGVLLAGLGGWGAFASIAGAIVATGNVAVENRNQAVEHIDGGTVSEVPVRNGDTVERDEVLLRFSDSLLRSEEAILKARYVEFAARRNRLEAEYRGEDAIAWDPELAALGGRGSESPGCNGRPGAAVPGAQGGKRRRGRPAAGEDRADPRGNRRARGPGRWLSATRAS